MLKASWILIADGSQARLMQQNQDGSLVLLESFENQSARREPHELESDKSGQASPGKTFEHTDPQRHAQETFAHDLAKMLHDRQNDFDKLTLVAGPKTLGHIRHNLTAQVRQKIQLEVDRDWTDVTLHDLPERLQKVADTSK